MKEWIASQVPDWDPQSGQPPKLLCMACWEETEPTPVEVELDDEKTPVVPERTVLIMTEIYRLVQIIERAEGWRLEKKLVGFIAGDCAEILDAAQRVKAAFNRPD